MRRVNPSVGVAGHLIAYVQTLIALARVLDVLLELGQQAVGVFLHGLVDRVAPGAALGDGGDGHRGKAVPVVIKVVAQGDHPDDGAQHRDLLHGRLGGDRHIGQQEDQGRGGSRRPAQGVKDPLFSGRLGLQLPAESLQPLGKFLGQGKGLLFGPLF